MINIRSESMQARIQTHNLFDVTALITTVLHKHQNVFHTGDYW